ncbi:hypothetical protein BGP78_02460 [Pseudoalteromonas sp. MSK9-3]|uniref:membrane lipoprotein lipid attachment site-containing protein n=1 Tax=Pseudoalteromonas sp. MSK9-3 TaxID=1897633 RepID=UPI000E6CE72D|nr:membrane lipoprotein lipid attachment site-containing protein [Pseudoalteromonas sp. MSK9-3]RJE75603.1 hypothetical protein BGP78_02460 [Pseudoalteromonas sp. MSK9-3]
MKKIIITLFSAVILSGCNMTDNEQLANNDGYKCEKIKTLGTSIPKRFCSTKKQRDELKERGQDTLRNSQRQGVLSGHKAGKG